MPVTFEQPDPLGFMSGPAQAGGYVQQYNADRQFALQAAALRNQSQGQQHNQMLQEQQVQSQAALQGAALQQRGQVTPQEQFAARQQQQMQLQQQGAQQALQQQHMQGQLAQQQQAAALGPAMFTQADSMELQRTQNNISAAQQEIQKGNMTEEEARPQLQAWNNRVDQLTKKQQATQTARQGKAATDAMHMSAQQITQANANDALMAKGAGTADGSNRVYKIAGDASSGTLGMIIGGKFIHTPAKEAAAAGTASTKAGVHAFNYADSATYDKALETKAKLMAGKDGTPDFEAARSELQKDDALRKQFEEGNRFDSHGVPTLKAITDAQEGVSSLQKLYGPDVNKAPPAAQKLYQHFQDLLHTGQAPAPKEDGAPSSRDVSGAPLSPADLPPKEKVGGQDVPAGYRTDAKLPGYVLPGHWKEGVHYDIFHDDQANMNRPVRKELPLLKRGARQFVEGAKGLPEQPLIQKTISGFQNVPGAIGRTWEALTNW